MTRAKPTARALVPDDRFTTMIADLQRRGLVDRQHRLTPAGNAEAARLIRHLKDSTYA